ncbi:hypothetical protein Hanom_Chr17g01561901 [Helianthus anomalus]
MSVLATCLHSFLLSMLKTESVFLLDSNHSCMLYSNPFFPTCYSNTTSDLATCYEPHGSDLLLSFGFLSFFGLSISFFLSNRRLFFLLSYLCVQFLSNCTGIFLSFLRGLLSFLLSDAGLFLLSCGASSFFLSFFLFFLLSLVDAIN